MDRAKLGATWQVNFLSKLYQGVEIRFQENIFIPDSDLNGPGTIEFSGEAQEFSVIDLKELPPLVEADGDAKGGK